MTTFDIGVIGGGLGGLSHSILAADAGYKVVLFEKENYPYHKVCGEYISMESFDFLRRLGVPLQEMKLPLINELLVTDVSGNPYVFKLPQGGFGISRYSLDDILYKIALEKGVQVYTRTKIISTKFSGDQHEIISGEGDYKAKVLVAGTGKRSNLDIKWSRKFVQQKSAKLNNYIGVKYHVGFPNKKEQIALHNFLGGYCGISSIEENKSCLCYLTTAANLKKCNNSIPQMEQQILQQNPLLKEIFSQAEFLYDDPLVISQVSFNNKEQVLDHMLMVGDAAGLITPLCGNGMSMAMHAAKIAFSAAEQFLQGDITRNQMENLYQKEWQNQFRNRLKVGRWVQRFFGNNQATSLFLKTISKVPVAARKLISLTHGQPF